MSGDTSGRDTEGEVITELCDQLSDRFGHRVREVDQPDLTNRNSEDCDRIVEWNGSRAAVEHTRIYSRPEFPGQIAILRRFRPEVEAAVHAASPGNHVWVMLPTEELKPGLDWPRMMRDLTRESVDHVAGLKEDTGLQLSVPGFD